jgi:hypothetical protein
MTTAQQPRDPFLTGDRRHRRIAYRASLVVPFDRESDGDMIDGEYRDAEGDFVGRMFFQQRRDEPSRTFLVIPEENIPLVHVEATLFADHRVGSFDQVFGLLYHSGEGPVGGVRDMGDRWDDGEFVVYTFETDEEALEAQG